MNIPLADLHRQYLQIKEEIDTAIAGVISSSQFILGKAVADFERAFAAAHGVKHCIAVGSGTDALHAALWGLGIGRGDMVVTTPFTFIATVEAISLTGATPAFVDIEPRTFTMDVPALERFLKEHAATVKAIIPVHLYGQPCAMRQISALARQFNVHVIEDACQAHAAKADGTFVGNFGIAGCFSFYPGKNIGAFGEGGAIVTNDEAFALKLRRLRDHGQNEKYKHAFIGHNYRMDGIQGAVLGVKLKYLEAWTGRRRAIAAIYRQHLAGLGDIVLPAEFPGVVHVYHLFTIRTKQRAALQKFLAEKEIATTIAYPVPLHFQEAYRQLGYHAGDFPVSEQAAEECLSLPIFAEMTDDQVLYVCESVRSFFTGR
jgi:dTDP-4-amino-4,6-dideoxygalactose transaminase